MARTLWILRHAEAEPHHARSDFDRRLTALGERQSRNAGAALARLGCQFDAVFSSPRVRALATAQLACEALGTAPVVHEPLSAGFDADGAGELLAAAGDEGAVLIVGHEPDLSQIVLDLTGARIAFPKGAVAVLREGSRALKLAVLLRPHELALLGDGFRR